MSLPPLVSVAWLAGHLEDPGLQVLDCSWYLPSAGRNAKEEFLAGHIPGARFFDLDLYSAHDTSLPHMLPSATGFAR
ncbi:MAG TPA: rhodanese-like domain-containing protein, partial [Gemmatimonadales bacterium]|nr:rhodanese-like domain-containing protein [Gemmatimonadales bacterium]